MTEPTPTFRDQLLAVDPPTASEQQRIHEEIESMLTKELTKPSKWFFGFVLAASIGMATLFLALLITEQGLPPVAKIGFVLGAVFALAWVAQTARVLYRGELRLKSDNRTIANMVWIFTVFMTVLFTYAGMSTIGTGEEPKGILMIGQSLVFLIGAGVYFLAQRIEQAELQTSERFLRLELQLAEAREAKQ